MTTYCVYSDDGKLVHERLTHLEKEAWLDAHPTHLVLENEDESPDEDPLETWEAATTMGHVLTWLATYTPEDDLPFVTCIADDYFIAVCTASPLCSMTDAVDRVKDMLECRFILVDRYVDSALTILSA